MDKPSADSATDRRWRRWAEIATIVVVPLAVIAIVVAVLDLRKPVTPADQGTTATSTITGAPTAAEAPGPEQQGADPGRALADLEIKSGASNIKPQDGALVIECASGSTSDPAREVEYSLLGAYSRFEADAQATEVARPELRTQLEVFADGVQAANLVLRGAEPGHVAADLESAQTLELRLTCQDRDTVLTLRNAQVSP